MTTRDAIDLNVESLEDRRMLTTVSVSGSTVRITGDNDFDFAKVSFQEGNIQVDTLDESIPTGLLELDKLIVNLKGGNDEFVIENGVRINKVTTIKLGSGDNYASIGGVHEKIRVIGGSGQDFVEVDGALPLNRGTVSLKGGEDSLFFTVEGFTEAIIDAPITEEEALALLDNPPKFSFNLGGGDDVTGITYEDALIDEDTVDDFLEDLGFDSMDDFLTYVEAELADLGLDNVLNILRVNGGAGNDLIGPAGIDDFLSALGARIRGFEGSPEDD